MRQKELADLTSDITSFKVNTCENKEENLATQLLHPYKHRTKQFLQKQYLINLRE